VCTSDVVSLNIPSSSASHDGGQEATYAKAYVNSVYLLQVIFETAKPRSAWKPANQAVATLDEAAATKEHAQKKAKRMVRLGMAEGLAMVVPSSSRGAGYSMSS
jgi:hypothetical protein